LIALAQGSKVKQRAVRAEAHAALAPAMEKLERRVPFCRDFPS
jgi:hypothetical protein